MERGKPTAARERGPAVDSGRERALRILVADDEASSRRALRGLLERERFEVVAEAANGHEAVRLAQELHPDVAVLDLGMPAFSGADIARAIHRESPEIRIVLLWMYDDYASVHNALGAGVQGYVLKTHARWVLADTIRQATGLR